LREGVRLCTYVASVVVFVHLVTCICTQRVRLYILRAEPQLGVSSSSQHIVLHPLVISGTSLGEILLIRPPRKNAFTLNNIYRVCTDWNISRNKLCRKKNQNLMQWIKYTPISYFHNLKRVCSWSQNKGKTETTILDTIAWIVHILYREVHMANPC
jgi:hypothetical protein